MLPVRLFSICGKEVTPYDSSIPYDSSSQSW